MKKLLELYRSLPPEMKTFLASAGVTSPILIIYFLKRFLFPDAGYFALIVGFLIVVGFLFLVGFGVVTVLGQGRASRQRRMAGALAADSDRGPVSMDAAAAIKANNEKFFSAVREMKKNAGVDVYALPWYIVLGDSGCGKTKLVNESGLTFSLGKPEGYKLGTLNYNWWFTEKAIFIDMAGRLCNPQEDDDHREWQAFLDMVRKGRKGFPINGVIVCVSADHLLEDPPEKVEQDANTMLERLRDLHRKLGVTFATYLAVTKCDKIVGFLQFFEHAASNVQVRNQMFGWSQPGKLDDIYDPESFDRDFSELYSRLNELRLRCISEEENPEALGIAYSFPEEFRELREPLNTCVNILFQKFESPRAVKNLFFRGIYFTSSTQEGRLSLKRLIEAVGAEAADQFAPLDLYPRKKPFFIKDLLTRKVVPEHGIVFRNEQQVARNRTFGKVVKVGGVGLTVVLLAALIWGTVAFDRLIGAPRELLRAQQNRPAQAAALAGDSASKALEACATLARHKQVLEGNPWPRRILSLGISSNRPVGCIQTARSGIFYEGVLYRGLREVEQCLREVERGEYGDGQQSADLQARQLADCLSVYLRLAAFKDTELSPPGLGEEELMMLFEFARGQGKPSLNELNWLSFERELVAYLETAHSNPARFSPARLLARADFDPVLTVGKAVAAYRDYLAAVASPDSGADAALAEWLRIRRQCEAVFAEYAGLLKAADRVPVNAADFAAHVADLRERLETVDSGFNGCKWNAPAGSADIKGFADAVNEQRRRWLDQQDRWVHAYRSVGSLITSDTPTATSEEESRPPATEPQEAGEPSEEAQPYEASILAAIDGLRRRPADEPDAPDGLDDILCQSLIAVGLIEEREQVADDLLTSLREVYQYAPCDRIVAPVFEGNRLVDVQLSADAQVIRRHLASFAERLNGQVVTADAAGREVPEKMTERIREARRAVNEAQQEPRPGIEVAAEWNPRALEQLIHSQGLLGAKAALTDAIADATESFRAVGGPDGWGLAELWEDYDRSVTSFYCIRSSPDAPAVGLEPGEPEDPEVEGAADSFEASHRAIEGEPESPDAPTRPVAAQLGLTRRGAGVMKCATDSFLIQALTQCGTLTEELSTISRAHCLGGGVIDLPGACRGALAGAKRTYLVRYFQEWRRAYDAAGKAFAERLEGFLDEKDWPGFKARMRGEYVDVGGQYRSAVADLLRHVLWADYRLQTDGSRNDLVLLEDARNGAWADVGFVEPLRAWPRADSEDQPWDEVAGEALDAWATFATAVWRDPDLPSDFLSGTANRARREIDWEILPGELNTLADLSFAESLRELIRYGRRLKAAEIQHWIVARQEHYGFASDRLPYVDGPGEGILRTVNPDQFQKFVRDITTAEGHFQQLGDSGLAGYEQREQYYRQCREWYDFLTGMEPFTRPLAVQVEADSEFRGAHEGYRWWDAVNDRWWDGEPPGDPGPNFHRQVELALGLSLKEGPERISFPTDQSGRVWRCEWGWPRSGGEAALIRSNGKKGLPSLTVPLGNIHRLLLPALLESIGQSNDRRVWRVALVCDIPALYRKQGDESAAKLIEEDTTEAKDRMVGHKFMIRLGQKLPDPISCMKELELTVPQAQNSER
jgi:hypothetical protein